MPRNAVSVFVLMNVCFVAGCHDVKTTWSAQTLSPDKTWLASARTEQHGGPGTAGVQTIVYLKQIADPRPPTQILLLDPDPYSQNNEIGMKMRWVTPSHLDLTYSGSATIDFEAVLLDGVQISVERNTG